MAATRGNIDSSQIQSTDKTGTGSQLLTFSGTVTAGTLAVIASSGDAQSGTLTGLGSAAGILPVARGGTGTGSPGLVAGTGISISGTWPNETITSTNAGGTVTSIALSVPSWQSVSGSPVTTSGTITISDNTQSPNLVFAGPSSGSAAAPTFRTLVAGDIPVFIASGSGHASGAVPDPGATAGTTRYLREDATWEALPVVIGFSIAIGTIGNGKAYAVSPRASQVTRCKVLTISSDSSTALTFTILQNGTAIFTSGQTIAAGTSSGTVSTITALTSNPLTVNDADVFDLNITSGSSAWSVVIQLET